MTRMTETESNQWKLENIELLAWLLSQENPHEFLADMAKAVKTYGALTPRQTAAVAKWQAGAAKCEAIAEEEREKISGAPELSEGRRILEGEILAVKYHDGAYGTQLKMTVRLDDGNKVWGTCPSNLQDSISGGNMRELVGKRVWFVATVKPQDEHFGFFSRPKDARLI